MTQPSRLGNSALRLGVALSVIGSCRHDPSHLLQSKNSSCRAPLPEKISFDPKIGCRKQLFVDDHFLESRLGTSRVLQKPTLSNDGLPILEADHPWEESPRLGLYSTVIKDKDEFKMWYMASSETVGYATSDDGIQWTKPQIGSQSSNIIFRGHGLSVFHDLEENDPDKRFKAAYGHLTKIRACLADSPDGIRWRPYRGGQPVTYRASDTHNQIIRDSAQDRFLLFTRHDFGDAGGRGEVRGNRIMENRGDIDNPNDWKTLRCWAFDRPGETKIRQVYALTDWIHEGVHFGLLTALDYPGPRLSRSSGCPDRINRHNRDVFNFYLATSRDGVHWDFSWVDDRQPYLPRGPDRSWYKDGVIPTSTIATVGDEHYVYFAGTDERHGCLARRMKVGLAKTPRDRLVAVEGSADGEATVTTKPFLLDGDAIYLNLASHGASVKASLLDEDGRPVAGFSGSDRADLSGQDGIDLRVSWTNQDRLSALKGQTLRLHLELGKGSRLYAMQVKGCD